MKGKLFEPKEARKAIVTFDNGQRVRVDVKIPVSMLRFHGDAEKELVAQWNKAQPGMACTRQWEYI